MYFEKHNHLNELNGGQVDLFMINLLLLLLDIVNVLVLIKVYDSQQKNRNFGRFDNVKHEISCNDFV